MSAISYIFLNLQIRTLSAELGDVPWCQMTLTMAWVKAMTCYIFSKENAMMVYISWLLSDLWQWQRSRSWFITHSATQCCCQISDLDTYWSKFKIYSQCYNGGMFADTWMTLTLRPRSIIKTHSKKRLQWYITHTLTYWNANNNGFRLGLKTKKYRNLNLQINCINSHPC